jgi:D-3-phosphoglycerate dehydrogenase / 2-oxoglutarate reductase
VRAVSLDATVLVTPRSFGRDAPWLRDRLEGEVRHVIYAPTDETTPEQLRAVLADVHGWIAGLDHIDADVLAAAPRLKVIARYGVGVDNVDLEAARRAGVTVTNTPGANAVAVAELALALAFAVARRVAEADRAVRAGRWPRLAGRTLAGRTVGIVGLGAIGREAGVRFRALGCTVVAHDPVADAGFAARHGIETASLEELVPRSQILSLHVPVTPATVDLVDAELLAALPAEAILVNAARGELVDEAALAEALVSGRLAGAGLDALRIEPPPPGHPLLHAPGVVLTPHIGAQADGALEAMGAQSLADCLAVLAGAAPAHPVL